MDLNPETVPFFVIPARDDLPELPSYQGFPRAPQGPSPLLATPHRRIVKKVFEETPAPPGLQDPPVAPVGEATPPWVGSLLSSMSTMQQYMTSQLVTRDQLEAYHQAQTTSISEAVQPIRDDLEMLTARVSSIENASSDPKWKNDPNDVGYKRISVLGVGIADALQRIRAIEAWFAQNFPGVRVQDVGNYYKHTDGHRKISTASYVEFSNSDVRDDVFLAVPGKPALHMGGKQVDIKKGLTKLAMARNGALRDAVRVITEDPRFQGATPKKESGKKDRGVTVNGNYVFSQGPSGPGSFLRPYQDLKLPVRRRP